MIADSHKIVDILKQGGVLQRGVNGAYVVGKGSDRQRVTRRAARSIVRKGYAKASGNARAGRRGFTSYTYGRRAG